MPIEVVKGKDGADYERCLDELKDKGDARYGICMDAYKEHHVKDPETGKWVRKKGHKKNAKGEWEMSKFAGLTDWFEIFRTGTWTDAAGNTKDWTIEDLDTIVVNYDPEKDEAPLVIGHPEIDSPAYGWVKGIKRVGEVLLAIGKDVVSEFEDMVKEGRFKKRSIRLTPDGTGLLHVGFLGATAPAVKGLKNVAFTRDDKAVYIEFADVNAWMFETIARIFRSLRDWLIEKEGKDTADTIIPDWDVEYIKEEARAGEKKPDAAFIRHTDGGLNSTIKTKEEAMSFKDRLKTMFTKAIDDLPEDQLPPDQNPRQFSEAEVKARETAAAERAATKAKEDAQKEFAAQQRTERIEKRKGEIRDYCENLKKEGRLIPAWEKLGLQEFMLNLDGEEVVEFTAERKLSRLDWFKGFMDELPKVINFAEIATRGTDIGGGNAAEKLELLIKNKMESNKELSYSKAFSEVQKENPDLAAEYQAEIKQTK